MILRFRKPMPKFLYIYIHNPDERVLHVQIFDTVKFMIGTGINPDEGISSEIITFKRELKKNIPMKIAEKMEWGKD